MRRLVFPGPLFDFKPRANRRGEELASRLVAIDPALMAWVSPQMSGDPYSPSRLGMILRMYRWRFPCGRRRSGDTTKSLVASSAEPGFVHVSPTVKRRPISLPTSRQRLRSFQQRWRWARSMANALLLYLLAQIIPFFRPLGAFLICRVMSILAGRQFYERNRELFRRTLRF